MRLTIRSKTLGEHTHFAMLYTGRDGLFRMATLTPMRNWDAVDFLDRLNPENVTDETPEGHEPVAARWAEARRVRSEALDAMDRGR